MDLLPTTSGAQIVQFGTNHWKCSNCKEGVIYSRTTGCVTNNRIWKCCRCGFADNSVLGDAACSFCDGTNSNQLYTSNDMLLRHESVDVFASFQLGAGDPSASSYIFCSLEPAISSPSTDLVDDWAAKVHQNFLRFDRFEQSNEFGTLVPPDNVQDNQQFEAILSIDVSDPRAAPDVCLVEHANYGCLPAIQDMGFHSGHHHERNGSQLCPEAEAGADALARRADYDEGYGSLSLDTTEKRQLSKRQHDELEELNPREEDGQNDRSAEGRKKRKRLLESPQHRLACPFYKRSPSRCKYKSCARPGFSEIRYLKQHLERDHLYHQCERCGSTFCGIVGAKALASHRRVPNPCQWQPTIPSFWGIDQKLLDLLKRRKRVWGKSDEQRWLEIYSLVISDAADFDLPTACRSSFRFRMEIHVLMA